MANAGKRLIEVELTHPDIADRPHTSDHVGAAVRSSSYGRQVPSDCLVA
ncbi:hypothetical protein [Streptomyces sp. NPDC093094]